MSKSKIFYPFYSAEKKQKKTTNIHPHHKSSLHFSSIHCLFFSIPTLDKPFISVHAVYKKNFATVVPLLQIQYNTFAYCTIQYTIIYISNTLNGWSWPWRLYEYMMLLCFIAQSSLNVFASFHITTLYIENVFWCWWARIDVLYQKKRLLSFYYVQHWDNTWIYQTRMR